MISGGPWRRPNDFIEMSAPSSVWRVARKSSSSTPSDRRSSQSALLPGSTVPRRRGPSNVPPSSGATRRVPYGTAPTSSTRATFTCIVINGRVFIRRLDRMQHRESIGRWYRPASGVTRDDRLIASIGRPWLDQSGNHQMPSPWPRNRLTEMLAIDYPIVQGPLGGLSSQRLTAAVSNFGGLGSFGAHGLAPEAIKDVIAQIRSLTSKPFAMNLWVSMEDEGARTSDESGFNRSLAPLAVHLAALGAPRPAYKPYSPARFEDQARVLLDANVPAFSFIYGVPPRRFWRSVGPKASSRLVRRQHPARRRYFRIPAWMRSSPLALRPAGIAVHSSGPRKTH